MFGRPHQHRLSIHIQGQRGGAFGQGRFHAFGVALPHRFNQPMVGLAHARIQVRLVVLGREVGFPDLGGLQETRQLGQQVLFLIVAGFQGEGSAFRKHQGQAIGIAVHDVFHPIGGVEQLAQQLFGVGLAGGQQEHVAA